MLIAHMSERSPYNHNLCVPNTNKIYETIENENDQNQSDEFIHDKHSIKAFFYINRIPQLVCVVSVFIRACVSASVVMLFAKKIKNVIIRSRSRDDPPE